MSVQEEKEREEGKPKKPFVRVIEKIRSAVEEEIPPEVFEAFDRMDEEQIIQELKGFEPKDLVYRFEVSGREVVGLSYAGTREAAKRYGYIEVPQDLKDFYLKETEDAYYVVLKGRDKVRDLSLPGAARQPKKLRKRNGTLVDDEHAFVKAVNKAARNTLRALLPQRILSEVMEYALELARMPKPARPPTPERPPGPPPPKPEEEATSGVTRAEAEKVTVRFIMDVPTVFDEATGRVKGPYKRNELALLPRGTAVTLIQAGKAVELKPSEVPAEIPEEKPETQREIMEREGLWMPFKASDGKEYGTFKVVQPGVLHVDFNQPLPLDPNLEVGPGGWMKRQLEAIRDKDAGEGKAFTWELEWVGDFLAGLVLRMEKNLDQKRLNHFVQIFSWVAMRSLEKT